MIRMNRETEPLSLSAQIGVTMAISGVAFFAAAWVVFNTLRVFGSSSYVRFIAAIVVTVAVAGATLFARLWSKWGRNHVGRQKYIHANRGLGQCHIRPRQLDHRAVPLALLFPTDWL